MKIELFFNIERKKINCHFIITSLSNPSILSVNTKLNPFGFNVNRLTFSGCNKLVLKAFNSSVGLSVILKAEGIIHPSFPAVLPITITVTFCSKNVLRLNI
jgi:hypothetical protein